MTDSNTNTNALANCLHPLIAAAIRAPSGDNCQPWQFRLSDDKQRLFIDILPERAKSFFDYQHRATFLSVGAVIENIRIEAAAHGYELTVQYNGGEAPGSAAATVSLSEATAAPSNSEMQEAMLRRSVNRRPYFRKGPSTEQVQALMRNPVDGTNTNIFTHRDDIKAWAKLIYLADRVRYSHPVIHQEVFGKILLSRKQIEQQRTGLEYDRLGIGPGSTGILKLLKPWNRMQKLSRLGADKGLSNQSKLLALSSGAIVSVSISDNSPESWMRSGEQVERLWIAAEHLGLCVHPMTVALYLTQRFNQEGMKDFLPAHKPFLDDINTGLTPLLEGQTGAMIFRLGKAVRMSGVAIRLPEASFYPADSEEPAPS